MNLTRRLWIGTSVALLAAAAVGCSDEDRAEITSAAEDARESVEDAAGTAAARAAAESLRAALKLDDPSGTATLRDVAVIQAAAEKLPDDLELAGLADDDGDGRDDDGRVEVRVNDQAACLIIPAEGDDTSVDNGPCS